MTTNMANTAATPGYASFREFYPDYLAQHSNRTSRRLHVVGTLLALLIALLALLRAQPGLLLLALLAGYLPAWVGHFFFDTPATFRHPLYSLRGDFRMLGETLSGRMRW
jgi:hypothetical protein